MQRAATPIQTDIVLIGGGHAHVEVIKNFGMRPEPGVRLTVIARDVSTPYSGMLPGYLAGHYSHDEAHVDLGPLCRFAGARLIQASAHGLDRAAKRVLLSGRPPVAYDWLSFDIGSQPNGQAIDGAERHALPVKPVDRFLDGWHDIEARIEARIAGPSGEPYRIVVIGGGAGGVEVALSLQHRLRNRFDAADAATAFTVLAASPDPLVGHARPVREAMRKTLAARGIDLKTGHTVTAVEAASVHCDPAGAIACDTALLLTHAGPAPWLAETGLALDPAGFIAVGPSLQSINDPAVFAAGDVAAYPDPPLPKSGVYAVRQGPHLARALHAVVRGGEPPSYRPQRRTLALISTGDPHAIASYGPLMLKGDWVWRWKDWIDRRWMQKYRDLPAMDDAPLADSGDLAHAMRCGGCGAKVASSILHRVLDELRIAGAEGVLSGLEAPDDAALLAPPPGRAVAQSVDQFRSFIEDPFLFAKIAVNHGLGDLYAMGAEPWTALATVVLPHAAPEKVEADLRQIMAGIIEAFAEAGVTLVGGHTGEGAELSLGFTFNGLIDANTALRKSGARPGDVLILTKPLGTGCILAADMRGQARSDWLAAALAMMLQSNRAAADILRAHRVGACTDVTGFGLAGHLIEMLRASGLGARLDLDALPALAGARSLLAREIASSLQPANRAFAESLDGPADGAAELLFDPQTAGGLLASLPAAKADACLAALRAAGYDAAMAIGAIDPAVAAGRFRIGPAEPCGGGKT